MATIYFSTSYYIYIRILLYMCSPNVAVTCTIACVLLPLVRVFYFICSPEHKCHALYYIVHDTMYLCINVYYADIVVYCVYIVVHLYIDIVYTYVVVHVYIWRCIGVHIYSNTRTYMVVHRSALSYRGLLCTTIYIRVLL